MGLEQPRFDNEENREQEAAHSPERTSNVIEFPKRATEAEPLSHSVDPSEQAATLGKLRDEILQFPDPKKEDAPNLEKSDEENSVRLPFTESYTKYKPCEACGGKGRRYLMFTCPVCKGLGSVPEDTSSQSGYYEVNKDGTSSKKVA